VKFVTRIRAVFDCNVFLQAVSNEKSPAAACFRLVQQKIVQLFVSEETLAELEEVLNRSYIKKQFDLSERAIIEFNGNLRILAKVSHKIPQVFSLPRDIDDEPYINLAVKAEADYIVTRDKDLLDLMNGIDDNSKLFRQKFRPLQIVKPIDFLRIVEEKIKETIVLKP
jgi:putative PIN family toxin of toxin-antitoxin system